MHLPRTASNGRPGRRLTGLSIAIASTVGFAALAGSLLLSGAEPRPPTTGIPDPGVLVGWLVPAASLTSDLAGIVAVGFLVLAALLMPSPGPDAQGLAVEAVRLARRAAGVWCVATIVLMVATTADVFAVMLGDLRVNLLLALVRDSEIGRGLALQALGALILALALRWTIGTRALLGWSVFALAAMAPSALTGHAASAGSHSLASVSLYLHVAAVAVWVGGLVALGWLASHGSRRLEVAVRRYSNVALACFVVIGISGVLSAVLRATDLEQLAASPYGRLVGLKLLAYVVLGGFGWWQRHRIVRSGGAFRSMARLEVTVMVAAVGIAVALSRTPTPGGELFLTPAEDLLGGPMPSAPTLGRLVLGWYPSGVGLAVVGFGAVGYALAVATVRRHARTWPLWRTASWSGGIMIVAWATSGGLGAYSHVLFSAHVANQALLAAVAAPLLVLGAPGSLAQQALPGARLTGENSPRDVLRSVGRSQLVGVATHPAVALAVTIASACLLYFTPLFTTIMSSLLGHLGMEIATLSIGTLFFTSVIGSSLVPTRSPRLRALAAGALFVLTACFSAALLSATTPVGGAYWQALERPFSTDLLADQWLGAVLALGLAGPAMVTASVLLIVQTRSPRQSADPVLASPGPPTTLRTLPTTTDGDS